jgi:outer membrane protein TolC
MNRILPIFVFLFAASGHFAGSLSASEGSGPVALPEIRALTVQEAVRMALERSPEILLAEAQFDRAGEALRESRSLNLPQVYTGTGLAYNNGFPLSIEGSAPSIFQVAASQSIFSKKNSNLIREARESLKASHYGTDTARNELALKTALAYYELHRARRIIELTTASLDAAKKQQKNIEALLDAGKVRPVDVTVARTTTQGAQQLLLVAEEQAKIAQAELQELTGISATVAIRTIEPRIDSPIFETEGEILYLQALESTPEILRAEATVKAKEFRVEAEKGESWPRMEIVSEYALFSRANNYEDYYNRFERNNYLIGLSVQVPLFNGFRTRSRVAQSRREVSEENYRLQRLKSNLKLDIQRGLSSLRIARSASDLAMREREAAAELLQVSETLLESGRISQTEFEDSRLQLQQKEIAVLDANQILFQRKLELLFAVGSVAREIQ